MIMRIAWLGLLVLIMVSSGACYTLTPLTSNDITAKRPTQVWVTRQDLSVVLVEQPQLIGDTLVGHVLGDYAEIPAQERRKMLMRKMSAGRTAAVVGGSIALIGIVTYLSQGSGGGEGGTQYPYCLEDPTDINCV
jgi:hypothetical protein